MVPTMCTSRLFTQENHSLDILPDIKRYRQSIFKINYKLKQKASGAQGGVPCQAPVDGHIPGDIYWCPAQ